MSWGPCRLTYPVHVEGEEDLVHVAVGVLVHAPQVEDGLQLEQSDEPRRRLAHELVVPVVHVLGQDLVQAGAVVAHGSSPTGSPRQSGGGGGGGGGGEEDASEGRKSFVLRVERGREEGKKLKNPFGLQREEATGGREQTSGLANPLTVLL